MTANRARHFCRRSSIVYIENENRCVREATSLNGLGMSLTAARDLCSGGMSTPIPGDPIRAEFSNYTECIQDSMDYSGLDFTKSQAINYCKKPGKVVPQKLINCIQDVMNFNGMDLYKSSAVNFCMERAIHVPFENYLVCVQEMYSYDGPNFTKSRAWDYCKTPGRVYPQMLSACVEQVYNYDGANLTKSRAIDFCTNNATHTIYDSYVTCMRDMVHSQTLDFSRARGWQYCSNPGRVKPMRFNICVKEAYSSKGGDLSRSAAINYCRGVNDHRPYSSYLTCMKDVMDPSGPDFYRSQAWNYCKRPGKVIVRSVRVCIEELVSPNGPDLLHSAARTYCLENEDRYLNDFDIVIGEDNWDGPVDDRHTIRHRPRTRRLIESLLNHEMIS